MAVADYATVAQQIYVAYFGRPADYYGLQNIEAALNAAGAPTNAVDLTNAYKTNAAVRSIMNSFATSAESTALYTGNDAQFINAIYNNVLNRDADVPGLNFWVSALQTGAMTRAQAAQNILSAAVRTGGNAADKALVENKVALAASFTSVLGESTANITAYSGDVAAAAARELFHTVTADTTVADFADDIAATLQTLINNAPTNSISLTTAVDALNGTAGNDTFNAIVGTGATLNALDSINGLAGTNTLSIKSAGVIAADEISKLALTITNVQNLTVSASTSLELSAADTAAFKSVAATSAGAVKITSTDATTVSATTAGAATIVADKAATVSLTNAAASTVDADALTTLNLTKTTSTVGVINSVAGARTLTVNTNGVTAGGVTDAAATAVVVNNTGAASKFDLTAGAAKSVTLGGSKGLEIGTLTAGVATTVNVLGAGGVTANLTGSSITAIDASKSSGDNKIAVDGTKASYIGGTGADSVSIAAKATSAIDGGAGKDVLVLNAAAFDFGDKVTGFEVLGLGANATGAYKVGSFTELQVGDTAAAVTFQNAAANTTLNIVDATDGVTVALANASGTSDVLNLVVSGKAAIAAGTITAAGVETINITATDLTGEGKAAHTLTLAAADATTLNVGGDTAITLNTAGAAKIVTFTSTNSEGVTFTSANNTDSVKITGGAGDDVLNASVTLATKVATIDGGAGDDVIVGGLGKDVILGGAGDDKITGGAGADNLTGGAGNDTFIYAAKADSTPSAADVITDFVAATADAKGDVIQFAATAFGGTAVGPVVVSVATNGTLALAALGATAHAANTIYAVLDASTGTLFVDGGVAPDGTADMAITLTGVTTLTAAAFTIV